ncbi:MAG TPA: SigmaK-factor processing regulatory BofA [Ruminiclostridium sp.]|nr:pro-sigmaK processing inhibitor BofA [Clostridiaceae bacterium]HAA25450.1 SigmaK-factor processing regulatory BofA [Ruminiclostridium sp.]
MNNNLLILIAWIAGILIVFAFGKALKVPLKFAVKLLINGVIGGIVILLINFIGQYFDFGISLNIFSALIVGTLGLPGVILLVILKYLL